MRSKIDILSIAWHTLFWISIFFFFGHYSFIRPSSQELICREYICVAMLLVIVYLNYFIFIPLYFQKGKLIIYWSLSVLLILLAAIGEYFLFKSILIQCFPSDLSIEVLNTYLRLQLSLYFIRASCFFIIFFIVRLYQDLSLKYIAESKALADSTKTMTVTTEYKDIKIIKTSDVAYLSHTKNNTYFYLTTGEKYFKHISLARAEELLPEEMRLRINKSNVIMLPQVADYEDSSVALNLLENGENVILPISLNYKENVLFKLKMYKNVYDKNDGVKTGNEGIKIESEGIKTENEGIKIESEGIKNAEDNKKTSSFFKFIGKSIKKKPNFKQNISISEKEIYYYILEHPKCKASEIFEATNKAKSTVERNIKNMKEKGIIEYIGSKKTGGYRVVKKEKTK